MYDDPRDQFDRDIAEASSQCLAFGLALLPGSWSDGPRQVRRDNQWTVKRLRVGGAALFYRDGATASVMFRQLY